MITFKLPDLGEGLQEAEIVTWHVEVGAKVVTDQPLVSVETDKAVVEVPSPHTGTIARLYAEVGYVLPVGAPLVDFDVAGACADSGTVVGDLAGEEKRVDEAVQPAPPARTGRAAAGAKVKATPAVRALARKFSVEIAGVDATGKNGLVTAEDVNRAAQSLADAGPTEPLRGVRRAMAQKMAGAGAEVVPATVYDEADIDDWPGGTDVSPRVIRAVAEACKAEPSLNAWYDSTAGSRRLIDTVDLGIATDTGDGLFVPVMRDVGKRALVDLRKGLEVLERDVEARRIPPEELRGATITLSNFGVFGVGRRAALVVVPPQVAIIGVGRISAEIVAVGNKAKVRRMLPLSLTFDHRVVTGGEAARFLAAMIGDLGKGG